MAVMMRLGLLVILQPFHDMPVASDAIGRQAVEFFLEIHAKISIAPKNPSPFGNRR
jgi:hypothetical protein